MARSTRTTNADKPAREGFDNFTLRISVPQSERMTAFITRHRLSVAEIFTFGLNIIKVKGDGSDRRMIDYASLNTDLASGESGMIAHSGRFTVSEGTRVRKFREMHNLSMPALLIYLMNEIGIGPAGEGRIWIDYETLTILQRE